MLFQGTLRSWTVLNRQFTFTVYICYLLSIIIYILPPLPLMFIVPQCTVSVLNVRPLVWVSQGERHCESNNYYSIYHYSTFHTTEYPPPISIHVLSISPEVCNYRDCIVWCNVVMLGICGMIVSECSSHFTLTILQVVQSTPLQSNARTLTIFCTCTCTCTCTQYLHACHGGARQATCPWTAVLNLLALIDMEYMHNLSGTLPSLYMTCICMCPCSYSTSNKLGAVVQCAHVFMPPFWDISLTLGRELVYR